MYQDKKFRLAVLKKLNNTTTIENIFIEEKDIEEKDTYVFVTSCVTKNLNIRFINKKTTSVFTVVVFFMRKVFVSVYFFFS